MLSFVKIILAGIIVPNSAFLLGNWKIMNLPHDSSPVFSVYNRYIVTNTTTSVLRMDIIECKRHTPDNYTMKLDNLQIYKKPSDWYNIYKYSKYIFYVKKILNSGLYLNIHIIGDDSVAVDVTIGDDKSISKLTLYRWW